MSEFSSRTAMLIGEEGVDKLRHSRVCVFGIGGVGSFAAEALARAGVGALTLVDPDVVNESNLNRQLIALRSTIGQNKAEVMARRIADINPDCAVTPLPRFYSLDTAGGFDLSGFDYIADAIDTVSSKLLLISRAKAVGTPIISCMGAGNKLDPGRFQVADIYSTSGCPLARVMRRELKAMGVERLAVVYSPEPPAAPAVEFPDRRKSFPGSISFAPSTAGLMMAGQIIRELALGKKCR